MNFIKVNKIENYVSPYPRNLSIKVSPAYEVYTALPVKTWNWWAFSQVTKFVHFRFLPNKHLVVYCPW
jgi:hypothetical protein